MREISDLVTVSTCFDRVTVSRVLSPLPPELSENLNEEKHIIRLVL